ncbi:MAG TPA: hypothetical protein VJN94_01905, partial [Candidatus Binataceae bacterium]|nr:hypothetical protein [Candidatus Binataceae bacterium]
MPQTRHHTNVACERGGIPKSTRVTQLCDEACGGPRADAVDAGKELSNFVRLEFALYVPLKVLHSTSQELDVGACVF